jgi:formamidopyrimidine-DNA glycosylase
MPELPEVETCRRGLRPFIEDNTLSRVVVRDPRLRWPVPDAVASLRDAPVLGWRRRAKYLLLDTRGGTLISHLGMSGSMRIVDPVADWRPHDHVEWRLACGRAVRYHDPRRFGCMLWQPADATAPHPLLAELGPEPLGEAFDGDHLWRRSRGRRQAVKAFIMDASTVVGVGNIYAAEALFMAGIHPQRAAGRVGRARYARLAEAIRAVLADAIAMGGTTLRDFTGSAGEPGYFVQNLKVYGREGGLCRVCGGRVRKREIGQRSSYYCPGCQH